MALYPVTTLTTLTKREQHRLIENDVILVKELFNASDKLKNIGLSDIRIQRVLDEVRELCRHNPN